MSGAEEKRVEAEIADGEREKRVEAEIRGREREKRAGAEIAGGPGEMGLYIHIPFCRSRCHYCDFPSTAGLPRAEQLRYKEALLWEWAAYRRPWPAPVRTLYVGGGTPTYLAEDILTAILTAVLAGLDEFSPPGAGGASRGLGRERQDKLSPLGAAGLTEFTVEANPGAVTAAKLASLRRLGCDRLSLGAQSFDDRYLAWLGRGHRAADFFQAWRLAREAGFAALNLDLIYGLPGQSPDHWKRTLLTALGLAPEHISLYQLSVEAGTVLGARAAAGEQCGAAEEVCRQQYLLAHQSLTDAGFVHYEISNYARPGSESRHNTLYWRNGYYLGLGLGAAGYLPGGTQGGLAGWPPDAVPGESPGWPPDALLCGSPDALPGGSPGRPPGGPSDAALGAAGPGGWRYRNTDSLADYLASPERGRLPVAEAEPIDQDIRLREEIMLALRLAEGIDKERFYQRFGFWPEARFADVLRRHRRAGTLTEDRRRIRPTLEGWLQYNLLAADFFA